MICRLCLNSVTEAMQIFGELGTALNVVTIIAKYFWFEPRIDDPISTLICDNCWSKVYLFHEFYLDVEQAHCYFVTKNPEKIIKTKKNKPDLKLKYKETKKNSLESIMESKKLFSEKYAFVDCEPNSCNSVKYNNDYSTQLPDISQQKLQPIPHQVDTLATIEARRNASWLETKRKSEALLKVTYKKDEILNTKGKCIDKSDKEFKRKMLEIDEKIARHIKMYCDICQESQENFLSLCKHMQQLHCKKGYVICCNKKFFKRSFLTDHIEVHENPSKFKCNSCEKAFADKQCLRNHELVKHQPESEKNYECSVCTKKFARQYLLEQHRIIHVERTIPCNLCDRRFQNNSLLSTHIKMVHTNYGTIMCDICAKVIRGRTAFAKHQLEHEGIKLPELQCNTCGSWHKNKYSLQKHMQRHNETNKQHLCNLCGKSSPNRSALLSHQRYVHKSERKFSCSVCKKAFKKSINLKEHMAMHTGEVLYKCIYCPKTFNSNANMHSHRKKVHPKEFGEMRKARNEKRILARDTPTFNIVGKPDQENELTAHIISINTEESRKPNKLMVSTRKLQDSTNSENEAMTNRIFFAIS